MTPVEVELWTSWASMLRVYAAAHGLTHAHHAVVEVGSDDIMLRVDQRWMRFTHHERIDSDGRREAFALHEDGSVTLGQTSDQMDMAAEQATRELFTAAE